MITIFTDTDTDIIPSEAESLGYKLISMPYILDDVEVYPYEDFTTFDAHAYYDKLRKGKMVKTFAISPMKYLEYFEPEFAKGNDILYVHFSSAMSGTFNAMYIALEELKEKYPDRKFYEIDTKGISIGSYNIVCEVADLVKQGKSIEEILDWAKVEVDKFAVYFYADDLTFFKRSGRVSGLAAFFGNIIGIKPVITMNSEGKMVTYDKFRGRKNALKMLVEKVAEIGEDIKDHRVIVAHCDAFELAELLAKMLKEKFGEDLKIEYKDVNPTTGAHCGPDSLGVSFHACHR